MRILLAALPLLGITPAYGGPPPAEVHGLTCGMTASGDGTGMVNGEPWTRNGAVTGGPLVVDAPEEVLRTTVDCVVVTTWPGGEPEQYGRSVTSDGAAAVLADTVTFLHAGPDSDQHVVLCTRLHWETASGTDARDLGCAPVAYGVKLVLAGEYGVVPSVV